MGIVYNNGNAGSSNDEKWKSDYFINLGVPITINGEQRRSKVNGSTGLRLDNRYHSAFIAKMKAAEEAGDIEEQQRLVGKLFMSFRPNSSVEDTEAEFSVDL